MGHVCPRNHASNLPRRRAAQCHGLLLWRVERNETRGQCLLTLTVRRNLRELSLESPCPEGCEVPRGWGTNKQKRSKEHSNKLTLLLCQFSCQFFFLWKKHLTGAFHTLFYFFLEPLFRRLVVDI